MKIAKVYTRTGDKGSTSLIGGVRISKSDIRLEAYGTVDELSSHLGLPASLMDEGEEKTDILRIQNMLFHVASHLATDQSQTVLRPSANVPESEIAWLEQRIDILNGELPEPQGFILPGGCQAAAQSHVCRTVCRRTERRIASLAEVATVAPEVQQYVNRLSDYLFVLAKKINFNKGYSEILWKNACK